MFKMYVLLLSLMIMLSPYSVRAEEPVDLDMVNRIRDEGFNHSQVFELLRHMTDVIGPRLTASPQMRQANAWALEKFEEWGLQDAHLEAFAFGRGWTYEQISVQMLTPRPVQLYAQPVGWTVSTDGPVTGQAVSVRIESKDDFENYEGKLEGKIVFLDDARFGDEPSNDVFLRQTEETLDEKRNFRFPPEDNSRREKFREIFKFMRSLYEFLEKEGAIAVVYISPREAFLLESEGYLFKPEYTLPLPTIVMASEHYNRVLRLLENDQEVSLEMDVQTTFYDDDPNGYNTIAEIRGKGSNPEIVMVGAHYDSWFNGDGAVDNGAGSAIIMEAMRILKSLNIKPNRTIRIALWSGEEQGLIGSKAYVAEHFASRPETVDEEYSYLPRWAWADDEWPITLKADHARLAAYFNIDKGSGRIRGIYTEGNVAVVPIFEDWFKPFADVMAETVVTNGTRGTDHLSYQAVGLPGYQFIQDPLDYRSRLHHTQADTLDYAMENDLKQAAVILASFIYHAAMRDHRLPRKPLPREPGKSGKDKEEE